MSIITRSTIPVTAIIRLAVWRYRMTLNRPAEDAKTEIRRVK